MLLMYLCFSWTMRDSTSLPFLLRSLQSKVICSSGRLLHRIYPSMLAILLSFLTSVLQQFSFIFQFWFRDPQLWISAIWMNILDIFLVWLTKESNSVPPSWQRSPMRPWWTLGDGRGHVPLLAPAFKLYHCPQSCYSDLKSVAHSQGR